MEVVCQFHNYIILFVPLQFDAWILGRIESKSSP